MNRYRSLIPIAVALTCISCGGVPAGSATAGVVTVTTEPASTGTPQIQVLEIDAPNPKGWEIEAKQLTDQRASALQQVREDYERELKGKAQVAGGSGKMDAASVFDRQIDFSERRLAEEKFFAALRAFERAMRQKPPDLPMSERAQALEARLKVVAAPVEITLKSDGKTYVSIQALFSPQKLNRAKVKLVPGDYVITGHRRNYADVTINLRVRNGEPAPGIISVICR